MYKAVFLGLTFLVLLSCQGTPRYGGGLHTQEGSSKSVHEASSSSTAGVEPLEMGRIIDRYLGQPYAGKGETVEGFDCSEFILSVYLEYASIHLPRTVEKLWKTGKRVDKGDLFFGDLVFFDTGGRGVSHVGIYVGFDEFAHSSSSNGIVISSLNDSYYQKRYLGGRRIIE